MLLVNASNLYIGGGLQVGVSVIEEFTALKVNFIAAVSPPIFEQLSGQSRELCEVIESTPSGIFNFSARKKLDDLVKKHHIIDVFTVFGPSYWNPKVKNHLVGFAQAWLIYDTSLIFKKLLLKDKIKILILSFVQPYFFKHNSTKLVTETDDVKLHVRETFNIVAENVFTISNTVSAVFYDPNNFDREILTRLPKKNDDIWLLTISHDYPHKNLGIITELIKVLPSRYKFILTVGDEFKERIPLALKNRVITLGKVNSTQCPPLYQVCDALFLPTLLECFSASYVEAMYMEKTIFTSDRDFAKTICGEAAYYFDPLDSINIAKTISQAYLNFSLMDEKRLIGKEIISKLPLARERAEGYLSILYGN
ncbi:Glycosyl transferases group 1 [Yersinia pekkanenii]|uniref:Glycosyl transferases group 1 n=2 Tax=Yersinia pekkanenii TaxID=1288385 RepID=A0A0T9NIQ2_9GAMM|nr:Glycosyl transferases group 1 [Yersinia pekkanenii]CRY65432.1 Glycosyl transferases group 1 [Yersinia pekkanenii]